MHGGEIYGEESGWLDYRVFEQMPGTKGPLWTYRRLIDASELPGVSPRDITMFNWPGNDYRDDTVLDVPAARAAQALQDAKRVSLGFLHCASHRSCVRRTPLYPCQLGVIWKRHNAT